MCHEASPTALSAYLVSRVICRGGCLISARWKTCSITSITVNTFRNAKSLVKHLLVADVTKRYGCLKNGANDIKNHRWFKNLDWFKLSQKKLPVPFLP